MNVRYGCLCFAIPTKALHKLADRAPEVQLRNLLHKQARAAAQLRVQRHQAPPATQARAKAKTGYSRKIFDALLRATLPGQLARAEGAGPTRDRAVDDAYENAGVVLDFYRQVFGRHSIDGRGMVVESAVHFGRNFGNAMWNGSHMIYGDGNQDVAGFTGCVDIIAHELTHGVTQHLVPGGLGVVRVPLKEREFRAQKYALKGQSGALNESMSDVFGSMVKQWRAKQDAGRADWLVGEGLLAPHHGRAIRSLRDPGNRALTWHGDDQIKSMESYEEGCDVHDASGIPNHAFYLAATRVGGKSWETVGPVWYEAFARLKPDAAFADAARVTCEVAEQRFGAGSSIARAVAAGWKKVKVIR